MAITSKPTLKEIEEFSLSAPEHFRDSIINMTAAMVSHPAYGNW